MNVQMLWLILGLAIGMSLTVLYGDENILVQFAPLRV